MGTSMRRIYCGIPELSRTTALPCSSEGFATGRLAERFANQVADLVITQCNEYKYGRVMTKQHLRLAQ